MSDFSPHDIDIVELHDAFTILQILAYEDLGFIEKGEGGKFNHQNEIAINPRGGILVVVIRWVQLVLLKRRKLQPSYQKKLVKDKLKVVRQGSFITLPRPDVSYSYYSWCLIKMQEFLDYIRKGEFRLYVCASCKKKIWPPSRYCPECLSNAHLKKIEGKGVLLEFTFSFKKY